MAYSYSSFKIKIRDCIKECFDQDATILDVGPGCGTYSELFEGYYKNIDGVEIFKENITKFNLESKYRKIYNEDIRKFKFDYYDLIIIGDVLEHMTVKEAKALLKYMIPKCKQLLVAVPYQLKQDIIENNINEIHIQDDLTPENMITRYPNIHYIIGDENYGYYVKDRSLFSKNILEPTLSLIMPCHNLEEYITPMLDSLINQKHTVKSKRELLFILDNCTDKTEQIIRTKMKGNTNYSWKCIKTSQGCAGGARNIGLQNMTGEYVWFIDGDDWLTCDNAIDIVLNCMLKDDMDIVEFKIKSNANPEGDFGGGTVWRAMLSKRIIGDLTFNNKQVGEDSDFADIIWNKPEAKYGKIDLAPYFYNFPRKGSLLTTAWNITIE